MSPSARDMFAYGGVASLMLGINGLAEEEFLQTRRLDRTDYVYNGCLQKGLPPPFGVSVGGVSFYLAEVAYPREQARGKLTEDQVPAVLRDLKRILNLTTTDLANICGVTRPTIYSWRKGVPPDSDNLKRLDVLFGLIRTWATRMSADLFSAPPLPKNPELKKMLMSENLNKPTLETLLASLAEVARAREASRPKTGRELAAEFGMDVLPEDVQERNMMNVRLSAGTGR